MSATFAAMQVIRYARTRHLTMTQVSRFVLLHTAPVPETTAPPFEERAATPGPIWLTAHGASRRFVRGSNFRRPDANNPQPHRSHPNHNRTHQLLGHLMPNRNLLIWAITGIWRMYTT